MTGITEPLRGAYEMVMKITAAGKRKKEAAAKAKGKYKARRPGSKVGKPSAKSSSGYGKGPGGSARKKPTTPTRKPPTLIGPISTCFVAGVQVELADGIEKNITEISVGDIVKTQDGNGSVVKVFHSKAGKQKLYGFNDKEPFVTEAHPFMTG